MNQFTEAQKKIQKLADMLISSIESAETESSKKYAVKRYSSIIENMVLGDKYHSLLDDVDVRKFNYDVDDIYEHITQKTLTWRNGTVCDDDEPDIMNGLENAVLFIEKTDELLC